MYSGEHVCPILLSGFSYSIMLARLQCPNSMEGPNSDKSLIGKQKLLLSSVQGICKFVEGNCALSVVMMFIIVMLSFINNVYLNVKLFFFYFKVKTDVKYFFQQITFQINSTENRSVLHIALRAARDTVINSDGKNVVPDVWKVLDKINEFSEKVRSGSWVCKDISFKEQITYIATMIFHVTLNLYVELPGWSYREGIERYCCCRHWWQLLGPTVCAHCSSNRQFLYVNEYF